MPNGFKNRGQFSMLLLTVNEVLGFLFMSNTLPIPLMKLLE